MQMQALLREIIVRLVKLLASNAAQSYIPINLRASTMRWTSEGPS